MAFIDDLKKWFEHDIRFATWDDSVKVDDSDPNKIAVRFYTDTNEYALTIITEGDEHRPYVDIEATVTSRKARAGQAAPRARRLLPVGHHQPNMRTWRRILGGIVGLELVRVHRREGVTTAEEENLTGHTRPGTGRTANAIVADL